MWLAVERAELDCHAMPCHRQSTLILSIFGHVDHEICVEQQQMNKNKRTTLTHHKTNSSVNLVSATESILPFRQFSDSCASGNQQLLAKHTEQNTKICSHLSVIVIQDKQ